MEVVFLARPITHPATRYRVVQYQDYLTQEGIQNRLEIFPSSIFAWIRLTKELQETNIAFIQKKRVGNFWLKRIKQGRTKIIYDLDDAVMFASSRHASPDSPGRMRRFIGSASTAPTW